MNIIIIGHSFLEPELQKNIININKYANVHCIVPRTGSVNLLGKVNFQTGISSKNLFITYRPIYITKSQYFLLTLTLGFVTHKPDIINISYNPWSLIYFQVWLYRTLFCRKAIIVCSVKKNTFFCKPGIIGLIKKWLAQESHHFVDHVFAESKMVSELLINKLNFPENKISSAKFLGIDVNLFKPYEKKEESNSLHKPFVVGYCGRFDAEKGILDLVDAMKMVVNMISQPIILRLMGKGAYHDSLDSHILALSNELDWIEVLSPVPNNQVPLFLQGIDILVLPSRIMQDHQEHDAHILLEALASGIPCIGTRSGIIPEILGDDVGVLVNPEKPNELAEAIIHLQQNIELRRELSTRGRRIAEQEYSLDAIAQRKIYIFRKLISHEQAK